MTQSLDPFVLELMASRLCHDLVSPVGAINNGIEFYEDAGPEAAGDAMELIAHSAGQAQAKLKCFRLCYGAGGREAGVSYDDVKEAFEGWISDSRFEAIWPEEELSRDPPPGAPKILLNILLLAEECGPGGEIAIGGDGETSLTVSVTGEAVEFRDGAEAALALETVPQDLSPRLVHAYILKSLSDDLGFSLNCEKGDGVINFELSF